MLNGLGLVVATVVAFVISTVFYALVPPAPDEPATPAGRPRPWQIALELARSLVVATLVAGLMDAAAWDGAGAGALLGLALWSLPVVLLAGSVTWERVPVRSAAAHAGDWLIKLVAIGAIVGRLA